MEVIRHRTYSDGRVKELVHVDGDRVTMSIVMVLPGRHNLGRARNGNNFIVTSGPLQFNGESVDAGYEVTVDPDEEIVIIARARGSFNRYYEYPDIAE